MLEQDWRFSTVDGSGLSGYLYMPESPRAALVIASALGVPQAFYADCARAFAARGIAVLTFDYRGTGSSAPARDTRFEHWGRLDLQAALTGMRMRFPGRPLFLLGHSIGAQLVGLAPDSMALAGVIFIAVTAPHPSQWRGRARTLMWGMWNLLIPTLAARRTRFPARRLGIFSMDVPAGVMRDWARFARSPRYLFNPRHGVDTARYRELRQPAISFEFTDDRYAPEAATAAFLRELPALRVTRRRIAPAELGTTVMGHFGYFQRSRSTALWLETADWILRVATQGPRQAAA